MPPLAFLGSRERESSNRGRADGPISSERLERLEEVRQKVREEFPPLESPKLRPATSGIAARLREAREAQGFTWYAVAKRAGIPNPSTVRDIEYGRATKLSNIQAVAEALGMSLELAVVKEGSGKRSP